MDTEAAAAFWSYTHRDDEDDSGRITRLSDDLRKEYRLLTGGDLTIFLDRHSIQWGDNLREKIDEALTGTTFLIPIITPTYFKSSECRHELITFSQEVKRLNVEALLLPVYYIEVPEFTAEGGLQDELMQLVKDTKYENWTKLRLEDVVSSAYRKGVHRLARRLADIGREVTSQPPNPQPTSGTSGGGTATEPEDDGPGLVDLLADGEEAMPDLAAIINELGPEMDRVTNAVAQTTEEILENNAKRGGATGVLKIMARLAETLKEPAARILDLGRRNTTTLLKVDPAVNAMIGLIEADPKAALEVEGIPDYVQGIRQIAGGGRAATAGLSEFSSSLADVGGTSRVLRPAFRDIQNGVRGFVDAQGIYEEWERRLAAIEGLPKPAST